MVGRAVYTIWDLKRLFSNFWYL